MSPSDIYRASLPLPIGGSGSSGVSPSRQNKPERADEFQELLNRELNFSKHAETRIRSREIAWSPELESRISQGMDSAESKGSREALILADNVAVIANVKSRTIVTAMDKANMKDRVFTNIDTAVLV